MTQTTRCKDYVFPWLGAGGLSIANCAGGGGVGVIASDTKFNSLGRFNEFMVESFVTRFATI